MSTVEPGNTRTRSARLLRLGLAVGALLAVAACVTSSPSGRSAISYAEIDSPYSPSEVSYAAGGRDFAVVVRGNPFTPQGVSDGALGKAVIEAMANQPGWFATHYTTTPGESAREFYWITWLFGVPPNTLIRRICTYGPADTPVSEEPRGNYMMAAFCRGDYPLSYLGGPLGDIKTVDDPRFTQLVAVATRSLLPQRDSTKGRSRPDLDN